VKARILFVAPFAGVATMVAEGVIAVINGERWKNVCNPKAYEHPRWNQ
jgi:D-3-phosphoglycerate dehydrogenase